VEAGEFEMSQGDRERPGMQGLVHFRFCSAAMEFAGGQG
jgi:hypothetical protein